MIRSPGSTWAFNFDAQVSRLSHPLVVFHEATHVQGNVLEARWQGFNLGTSPYVSWIDDDGDEVLDMQWIDYAVHLLDSDPSIAAVYPRWRATKDYQVVHESKAEHPALHLEPHHLTIMRRKNVIPMLQAIRTAHPLMMVYPELMLTLGSLRFGKLIPLNVMAYQWVQHSSSARSVKQDPATEAFALAHMKESLTYYRV